MKRLETDVVVIGGGSTGAGVLRDAAMRGYRAILVDRSDLAQGTTGRFHGLLHSGGRYVVSDPGSATECAEENAILRRIQAPAIERTGGLFVTPSPATIPTYGDRFLAGAAATGVPAPEISVAEALPRAAPQPGPLPRHRGRGRQRRRLAARLGRGELRAACTGPRCSPTTR